MPGFRFFGYSVVVLRASNLFWGLVALLFFMLGTWRWLGLRTALFAGSLLALDSTYFFLCVWDWGVGSSQFSLPMPFFLSGGCLVAASPSPATLSWPVFLPASGFFNKIDFCRLLIGVAIAGLVCFGRPLLGSLRTPISAAALSAAGFLLGAGAMLFKMPRSSVIAFSGTNPSAPGEFGEKLHTMLALYDGSYFYRLMNVGGVFERMFSEPVNWLPIFGSGVVVAGIALRGEEHSEHFGYDQGASRTIFPSGGGLVTLGVILLPGAVRIHHAVLVYPLPQLIIAIAANISLGNTLTDTEAPRDASYDLDCIAGIITEPGVGNPPNSRAGSRDWRARPLERKLRRLLP